MPDVERQKSLVDQLNEQAYEQRYNNTDLTYKLAEDALELARKISYQAGEAWALRNRGIAKAIKGDSEGAVTDLKEALQRFEAMEDFRGLGLTLSNIGTAYQQAGRIELAAQYLVHALRYLELVPDLTFFYAQTLANLGSLFAELGQLDLAEAYHQKALALHQQNQHIRGTFFSYVTLSSIYQAQKKWDAASEMAKQSLDVAMELGEKDLVVRALLVQAENLNAQGRHEDALRTLERAENLADQLDNPSLLVNVLTFMADASLTLKQTAKARTALARLEELQKSVKDRVFSYFLPELQARLAEQEGRWAEAYHFLRLYADNRLALLSALNKDTLATLDRILRQELVGLEGGVREEVRVAQRIQEIVLHGEEELRQVFPQSVYWLRSKEAVSGDFLWVGRGKEGAQLLAVLDASGFGVSAAILSTMAHTLLYEIFSVRGVTDPGRILSQLHKSLLDLLYPSAKKDNPALEQMRAEGFQAGISVVFPNLGEVHYAGAMIPLWLYNPVLSSWEALQPDKRLIGQKGEESGPRIYNSTIVPLEKGSVLFFFTDGWERLVSAQSGKRFGRAGIRDWLAENAPKDLQAWFQSLKNRFEEWRAGAVLTDDVLMVAVQI